jgi:hypothetical protein
MTVLKLTGEALDVVTAPPLPVRQRQAPHIPEPLKEE